MPHSDNRRARANSTANRRAGAIRAAATRKANKARAQRQQALALALAKPASMPVEGD